MGLGCEGIPPGERLWEAGEAAEEVLLLATGGTWGWVVGVRPLPSPRPSLCTKASL